MFSPNLITLLRHRFTCQRQIYRRAPLTSYESCVTMFNNMCAQIHPVDLCISLKFSVCVPPLQYIFCTYLPLPSGVVGCFVFLIISFDVPPYYGIYSFAFRNPRERKTRSSLINKLTCRRKNDDVVPRAVYINFIYENTSHPPPTVLPRSPERY